MEEKTRKIKKADGSTCEMTYNDICAELGFSASIEFVKITNAGTISFTCGKMNEVRSLLSSVISNGYIPAKRLITVSGRNDGGKK